jgi:N,N'-diacetylchitobiose transport system permease protein
MMSGAVVFSVPSVVFFLVLQRYVVSGLAAGAVKG